MSFMIDNLAIEFCKNTIKSYQLYLVIFSSFNVFLTIFACHLHEEKKRIKKEKDKVITNDEEVTNRIKCLKGLGVAQP